MVEIPVEAEPCARDEPAAQGQFGTGLRHRVRVDRKLLGKSPDARQLVADREV